MKQAFFLLTFAFPILAAEPKYDVRLHYQKSEHEIPMRDGVRLHTTIYTPRTTSEKLPFLLVLYHFLKSELNCTAFGV